MRDNTKRHMTILDTMMSLTSDRVNDILSDHKSSDILATAIRDSRSGKSNGKFKLDENWYPENNNSDNKCDISGCLHDLLHKYKK